MLQLVGQLGIPALVAAVVTFIFNRTLEKSRGRREINSRVFESAREEVRKLAQASAVYWLRDWNPDDPKDETLITLLQEDTLAEVGAAIDLIEDGAREEIETALDELIRFVTGGDFQKGQDRTMDLSRARRIPGAASRLRRALMTARRELLDKRGH